MLSTLIKKISSNLSLQFLWPLIASSNYLVISGRAIPTKALGGFIYKMEEEDEVEEDDDEGVIAEVRDADRDHAEGAELSGRDPNNRVYEEWTEKAENEARGKGPILNRDVEKEKK